MSKIAKKIASRIVIILILLGVGIFFGGSIASASTSRSGLAVNCDMDIPITHASVDCESTVPVAPTSTHATDDCETDNRVAQKTSPMKTSFMPCCLERHDNSESALPSVLQDRIKFSEQAVIGVIDTALTTTTQKTYLSSKSPPKRADILSSVVKIE